MSDTIYEWKGGARISASPTVAGPVLERFARSGGTASDLLANARKRKPGHWLREELWVDKADDELAEEMRLERARLVLRSIVIKPSEKSEPRRVTFAAHVQKSESEQTYVRREDALNNVFLRQQVIRRAEGSLRQWLSAYGDISEFKAISSAIRTHLVAVDGDSKAA